MKIYVTVKSLGKRKNALNRHQMELTILPETLKELLMEMISVNVQKLMDKQQDVLLITYLIEAEIKERGETGKVGLDAVYNENVPEPSEAVDAAFLAFEDRLFKVFIREEEVAELNSPLQIEDGDEIVLLRFTMLAGSLW
ncbi:hypothetical protein JNUCC42_00515 [Brevibacterium sp. JNUCC-42]|nr:hypothetical protein JNUCC42_00515 [Brevibacterium sp. JNUCC-42]